MDLTALCTLLFMLTFTKCTSLNTYTNALYNYKAVLDKKVIPLGPNNEPVEVEVGVTLVMVSETEDNKLAFNFWLQQSWKDSRLAYTEDTYTDVLHIPFNDIWLPDITGYDVASFDRDPSLDIGALDKDGTVHAVPKYYVRTFCDAGPFQNISCTIKLGSWVYSGNFITLKVPQETVTLEKFGQSKFEVVGTSLVKDSKRYECCPEVYEYILVTVNVTSRADSEGSDSSMESNAAMARKAQFSTFPVLSLIYLFVTLWFKA